MNDTTMIGRLVQDPDVRMTANGTKVCTFRIAVRRKKAKEDGPNADFFDVVAWKGIAELIELYVRKGDNIAVRGAMQNRRYEAADGSTRYATEIVAEEIELIEPKREL